MDFVKQAHRGESREKLSARLKRNETNPDRLKALAYSETRAERIGVENSLTD
jgi:hypothetical protein